MKVLLLIGFLFLPVFVFSDNGLPIKLEKAPVNIKDRASILRGAQFYAKNCMVCHTMKYLQHNKLAKEAGITLDKMPLKEKEWYLGIVPPDLTLAARRRSANWLYTYMISFYRDPSRPTGYNNLLAKEVNMPNIFLPFQGEQVLTARGKRLLAHSGFTKPRYYSVLELVRSGSLSPEQFDQAMTDLVTFLVYASDPGYVHRIHVGVWVALFLLLFFIIAFLLKKVYWKGVPRE